MAISNPKTSDCDPRNRPPEGEAETHDDLPQRQPASRRHSRADAAEQRQLAEVGVEDAGLDTGYLANLIQRDANPSDVIDQAIIAPMPDDDRDVDTDLF
jgi:hypothetical protein